jgi:hypothetical protein
LALRANPTGDHGIDEIARTADQDNKKAADPAIGGFCFGVKSWVDY